MKIKVKVKNTGSWPPEYNDQVIEVEVTNITLPNGVNYYLDNLSFIAELETESSESSLSKSIRDQIGQDMAAMTIEFHNKEDK